MNWLKRLVKFAYERELRELADQHREQIASLAQENEIQRRRAEVLESQNVMLLQHADWLRTQMADALQNERFAMRVQANIHQMATAGIKPHADAPGPPDPNFEIDPDQPTHVQRFRQGADIVRQNRQNFAAELKTKVENHEISQDMADAFLAATQ